MNKLYFTLVLAILSFVGNAQAGTVTLNRKKIVEVNSASAVYVLNGRVIIDNKDFTPSDTKEIDLAVNGSIKELKVNFCEQLRVHGDVETTQTEHSKIEVVGAISGVARTYSGAVLSRTISGPVFKDYGDVVPAKRGIPSFEESRKIKIFVNGTIKDMKVGVCSGVRINGNAKDVQTHSGNIEVSGTISGAIQTKFGVVSSSIK